MTDNEEIVNPLTNQPVSEKAAELIRETRTVRSNARRASRSGHPGRRAEAKRVEAAAPEFIRAVYARETQG